MPDLNEWKLEYGDVEFDFGTMATDFPLSVQVDISDADPTYQDSRHPTSDGSIFGRDSLGGFDLTFDLTTLPDFPPPAKPWTSALDLFSEFRSAWRADQIRRVAGAYATLTNLDRGRLVYGRPRKCAPKHQRLRKGIIEYVATFNTNDPNFYSAIEKQTVVTPVPPVGGGSLVGPLIAPLTTSGIGSSAVFPTENEGDLETWPMVTFHGPGHGHSLELLDGPTVLWKIVIPTLLNADMSVTVDTRPWSRSATAEVDGKVFPANGLIRGTQLEKCTIPVGEFDFRYKVTDPSGIAFADVKWRDAFASL